MKKIYFLAISILTYVFIGAVNHSVTTVGNTFSPANININLGDTVTWTNGGGSHNVNATLSTYPNNPEGFGNSVSSSSWSFQHIFSITGTYDYQCDPHTSMGMVGTVQVNAVSNPLVGTWKLSPVGGALAVGPNQGDGSWWSNPLSEVTNRACIFDDSIKLENNGNMTHYMDGSTWLESWQGVSSEQCGSPVAPHDGGSDTWSFSNNQLIVNGVGAHFGLPKAYNGGELDASATVPASRTYEVSFSTDSSQMYLDIASAGGGSGWWRFIYQKTSTSPPANYNVTLKVNTANITVGANGMYAGGGFLGGSDGLQLTDADGDGTWEGVATVSPGSGPNYYAFFNSPSHGSDWGTKEDLAGTTCGISSNYNDRVLPTITSDTTIQHCYGNCAFDGTCTPPVSQTYDLTLSVNTASITVGANGMYAGGGVLGDAMAVPLSDPDGDGTWTGTVTMNSGVTGNYIFLNSPTSGGDWGAKEDLSGLACSDPANYNDRILPNITADTTMLHCFGSCETDGTCPGPPPTGNPVLVTYNVDINDYLASGATLASNGIRIAGNFGANGALSSGFTMPDWNPTDTACAMSDPDGDNIWSITVSYGSLPVGTQQFYKFVNGNWGGDESVNDALCGGAGGFGSDRFLTLPSNDSVVCYKWATCNSCSNQPSGDSLVLVGVIDFTVPGGGSTGKAIHVRAVQNISDLSIFGIGVANNGGGTDGQEYTFPSISVNAGDEILLARDTAEMAMYFDSCFSNFHHVLLGTSSISQNGDDAIELFKNGNVVETFGDINVDGTGEPWEYMDSWAYKLGPTVGTPGPTSFSGFDWSFGAVNCTDGSTTTQSSSCPYPFCGGGNPPPASTYNVTLEVNTATIYQNGGMVGSNGMYAGGGFLGGADGLQLVQSTVDSLLWTGVASVVSGSGPNYYAFFNSPNSGSDWGTKENLNGLPCGDPANYNDRLLPNIMSDTTIQHCFGSCETDGSCPPPPSSFVNVTFTLNVSSIISTGGSIDSTGMFIAGGGTFGNPGDNPMTDLGGGIWSFTVTKPIGFTSDYTFTNGNSGWGAKENISGLSCAVPPYDDRNLAPVYSDTTIQHCFGTCDYDGTCNSIVTPPTGINITFQVDMSQVSDTFSIPEVNATFNNWCGNCNAMSDADSDNIWDVTVSLTPGDSVEYKYSADSWAIQEMNDPGAPCTNGDSTYTNRVLVVPSSDTILGVVCWASCDPCGVVPPTGISDYIDNVTIYPNPANNVLNISSYEIIQKIEVLDVVGRVIMSKTLNSSNYILDVSNLNSNVYFINYTINGVVNSKKVIVNN